MLIGNETKDDHMMSLVKVFERLAGRGYSVKAKKVKILPDEFEFLGHLSTPEGLKPLPKAIEAIEKMPKPRITENCDRAVVLRQLRSFLGLASYNRRYVKNFSKVAAPLNTMLEKDAKLEWTPDREDAWNAIIIAIAETRGVYHPDYNFAFHLRVDASKRGIGGYLFQMIPNPETGKLEERVIEYFSRSVPKEIQKYEAQRLEMLAVIETLEHFKPIFEGHVVQVESDHRNLVHLRDNRLATGQIGRWGMRLAEFSHELKFRPGRKQPVSDCLSRNPIDKEIEMDEYGEPLSVA
mmetsp:Transcript_19126/g.61524  ORF Transcript_19126/g.61524 Transcript_19126/m.61524 type:complete len:294 (+) Transcript_19126:768-1649(+)